MKRMISILLILFSLVVLTGGSCSLTNINEIWDTVVTWIDENSTDPVTDPVTPTPTPDPVTPTPDPVVEPVEETIIVADLNTTPGRMRAAGFEGSDNMLWFALAYVACYGPGQMPDDGAGSLNELSRRSAELEAWWWAEVSKDVSRAKSNPKAKILIIASDGHDRCGFRLGPSTMDKFAGLSNQVELGNIYQYSSPLLKGFAFPLKGK